MKRILFLLAFALVLVSRADGAQRTDSRIAFGSLEALSPEAAKTKLVTWLRTCAKADADTLTKLNAIWNRDLSVLDRIAHSLALGDPSVARLIADARDQSQPVPISVPALFRNDELPIFVRANAGLIYAQALTNRLVYEEALATLKLFSPEQVADPAAYLFHRAVCEHAMLRKADATRSIARLLEEASSLAPERYKTVATLMLFDMHMWKDKDLAEIGRKMENIERRLIIARGGPETQRQQKEVLNRLDELIMQLENQNKGPKSDGGQAKDGSPSSPSPGRPGDADRSSTPATQSQQPADGPGSGNVENGKFRRMVAEWGRLPPGERIQAVQELTQGMPARHREAIENYFRNLTSPK